MSAREEAATLRGVIQSIATIGAAATDPLAKAMYELARQGIAAADRVSEKADAKRARQRESYDRQRASSGPPPDIPVASDARRERVGSASEDVGSTSGSLSDSPSPSRSSGSKSLSDSVDMDPSGIRARGPEAELIPTRPTNSDTIPTPVKRGRRAKANTSAADPSDAVAWLAWCAAWELDAGSSEVKRFADYYRARGLTWRDWKAAWRNWERKAAQWNGRHPPTNGAVQPVPATGRLWSAKE